MNRSVTLDPSLGDAWASYLAFELENGGEKECIDIINRCALAQPNRGQSLLVALSYGTWPINGRTTSGRRRVLNRVPTRHSTSLFTTNSVLGVVCSRVCTHFDDKESKKVASCTE